MEGCNSSMQLTRAADYAIRVMVHLATLPRDARESLLSIAKATGSPESFLSKVLQALTRARLVSSRRGQSGGFQISLRGWQASVREVIEAIDGPLTLNVCLNGGRSCPRKPWCPTHPVWLEAQEKLMGVLESALIVDLAARSTTGSASVAAPDTRVAFQFRP